MDPSPRRLALARGPAGAAQRSSEVGDGEMSEDIRWIRSYVLEEHGGAIGTVCIYQASSPEAIRSMHRRQSCGGRNHPGDGHRARPLRSTDRIPLSPGGEVNAAARADASNGSRAATRRLVDIAVGDGDVEVIRRRG